MEDRPVMYKKVSDMVEESLARLGGKIVMGMPIGAGKPTIIANEFYRRAKEDPGIELQLLAGLSLETPKGKSELEKRFLGPLMERILPDFPDPEWMKDARKGALPPNVTVVEYYLTPGAYLNVPHIQQNYTSSNYSHIARDMAARGVNVGAAILSKKVIDGKLWYSLSSNASAAVDMMTILVERRRRGEKIELLGQVNDNMPFMYGGAVQDPAVIDRVLDSPEYHHVIFGPPREAITTEDYLIGLYASALVKDGGTIQIGIGSLGDAIGWSLKMRREDNALYNDVLSSVGAKEKFGGEIERNGGAEPLPNGVYGCTEMLTDPFIQLLNAGIITRDVYDWLPLQKLVSENQAGTEVSPKILELLLENEGIHYRLTESEFRMLVKFGIFKDEVGLIDGNLCIGDLRIPADLHDHSNFKAIADHCLGDSLKNSVLIHGGFFMGPPSFYDALRNMPDDRLKKINMREISYVNQLYGSEDLKRLQRQHGRFFNTAMMVTMLGAAVSDTLESGQVVSGVGGQYNFVAMAHALDDGRSSILVRSTRLKDGVLLSNLLWNYGQATIPRHLRDIFISEYGIADVRSRSDKDVIAALLNITDSRFQDKILEKAKQCGKMTPDYRIPDLFRRNFPEKTEKELEPFRKRGLFKPFPYGTEMTAEELVIGKALKILKSDIDSGNLDLKKFEEDLKESEAPKSAAPFLERMKLDKVSTKPELLMRELLLSALLRCGV